MSGEKQPGDKGYGYYVRKAIQDAPWQRVPSIKVSGGKSIGGKGIRQVMEKLAQHADNQTGRTWVGAKKISAEIGGMHRDLVGAALKFAEANGWIEVVGKKGRSKERLVRVGTIPEPDAAGAAPAPNKEEDDMEIDRNIIEARVREQRRKDKDTERAQKRPSVISDAEPVGGLRRDPWGRYEDAHGRKYGTVEEARRHGRSQDVTPMTTVTQEHRRSSGERVITSSEVPDPTGRIATWEEKKRAILAGEIEPTCAGPAWAQAQAEIDALASVPSFD